MIKKLYLILLINIITTPIHAMKRGREDDFSELPPSKQTTDFFSRIIRDPEAAKSFRNYILLCLNSGKEDQFASAMSAINDAICKGYSLSLEDAHNLFIQLDMRRNYALQHPMYMRSNAEQCLYDYLRNDQL